MKPYEPLYTVKEASKVLKTNTDTVYSYIRAKKLKALRLGSIKIRGADLEQFITTYPEIEAEEANATGS